jgi:hypothetical protein
LCWAVWKGSTKLVSLLINSGALFGGDKSPTSESPFSCAILRKEFDIFSLMLEHSSKLLECANEGLANRIIQEVCKSLTWTIEIRWFEGIDLLFSLFGENLFAEYLAREGLEISEDFTEAIDKGLRTFRKPSVMSLGWSLMNESSFLSKYWKCNLFWEPELAKEIVRFVGFSSEGKSIL